MSTSAADYSIRVIEFARASSPLGLLLHGQAGEREIRPGRHKVIARWQSFHGSTLATLSLSGRPAWREPFLPMLPPAPHIVPPYCYRCPLGHAYPDCGVACADDLERTILMEGPDSIAAFIAEPVIGSTVTGVVPVPEYYRRIREICDAYDVLFIADEVLTGYGRTGRWLAIEHWGVEPDIVVMGKGISGGYVPLGAVLAAPRVVDAFIAGSGTFSHGFTYSGNPLCTFVGLQVLRYAREHGLFDGVAAKGHQLHAMLGQLAARHEIIGDVRGLGLFAGVEFVADRASREPFGAAVLAGRGPGSCGQAIGRTIRRRPTVRALAPGG